MLYISGTAERTEAHKIPARLRSHSLALGTRYFFSPSASESRGRRPPVERRDIRNCITEPEQSRIGRYIENFVRSATSTLSILCFCLFAVCLKLLRRNEFHARFLVNRFLGDRLYKNSSGDEIANVNLFLQHRTCRGQRLRPLNELVISSKHLRYLPTHQTDC